MAITEAQVDAAMAERAAFIRKLAGPRPSPASLAYAEEIWRIRRGRKPAARPSAPAAGTVPDFRTCVHEAGHVVCALAQRVEVFKVSVQGGDTRNGHCDFDGGAPPFDQAVVLLGGLAAVEVHQGCQVVDLEEVGADADLRSAAAVLNGTCPVGAEIYLGRALDRARQIVRDRWADVRQLADVLQRRGRLTGDDVADVLAGD